MTEPLSLLLLPPVKLEKQGGEEESGGYPWAREWLGVTPQLHSAEPPLPISLSTPRLGA